ncbi:hypothetical protein Q4555_08550 [Octadecabacter sp. 1_MG-2023]|uniref:hypothetical protein n=1 Tax=unclassified Octadecabacter TaxID=196158 RepID=UPI001C09E786|nr:MULTISPECIES: hypothetical protein [unclassified Octadecabacter]MBU2992525.1 hypothetical protein [Octadecabacter sp. B2R22]MDO6734718.1 hypothetical protein [Octadecabacter sp. 1_MG-2023]
MSETIELTKLRLAEGVWHGALKHNGQADWQPNIEVTHLDYAVDGVVIEEDRVEEHWLVSVPVPINRISDGVQTFVIRDRSDDTVLGNFSIIAGDALAEDIRAELSLVRAELDMLKKAFRRHCVETADNS